MFVRECMHSNVGSGSALHTYAMAPVRRSEDFEELVLSFYRVVLRNRAQVTKVIKVLLPAESSDGHQPLFFLNDVEMDSYGI